MNKSKYITTVEADLIFTKMHSKKKKKEGMNTDAVSGKMEFHEFMAALKSISEQLYPDMNKDEAMLALIQDKLSPLEKKLNIERTIDDGEIEKLMEVLKDNDVLELLGIVHKTLYPYYSHYADDNGYMQFKHFSDFAKDFGIFPDYLPKSKLYKFFQTLAGFYKQNSKKEIEKSTKESENEDNNIIDEHLFIELLVLCSLEVYYRDPQPSPIEKIIYLVEKMTQSSGPAIFRTRKGRNGAGSGEWNDFLLHLKLNYPYFFELTTKRAFEELEKIESEGTRKSTKSVADPLAALFE